MKTIHWLLVVLLVFFLWFEVRPAFVRSRCSSTRMVIPAQAERQAMTEQQLKQAGILKSCNDIKTESSGYVDRDFEKKRVELCIYTNQQIIDSYRSAKPATSEKIGVRSATDQEYLTCLRQYGVSR